jgi:hypothetical protein
MQSLRGSSLVAESRFRHAGSSEVDFQKHTIHFMSCRIILPHNLAIYIPLRNSNETDSISTSTPTSRSCPQCT